MLSGGAEVVPANDRRSLENTFNDTLQGDEKFLLSCFDLAP